MVVINVKKVIFQKECHKKYKLVKKVITWKKRSLLKIQII